jgi:hypothetical protein
MWVPVRSFRRRSASPPGPALVLELLEDRSLLANGLSPTLVALGGATPRPIQFPLTLAANPFGGPDIYQNFPGPADARPIFGNEPNQVTDFVGLFGGARVQGDGFGTLTGGTPTRYLWDADLRFMQGVYRGLNGGFYHGTFVEI